MGGFGEYLRKRRLEKGLTQEEIAHALEVSTTYIHQLEKGKIDAPNYRRCDQLAQLLSVPFEELWSLAFRERLTKYAERAGLARGAKVESGISGVLVQVDGVELSPKEKALIRLYRRLDEETRKNFDSLIVMLFRHYPKEEVQQELKGYMESG